MKRKNTINLSLAPPINLKTAYLEITTRCNLNCLHCYVDKTHPREIDLETMFDIFDKLVEMRVKNVVLFGGEPTLHRNFWDLLQYAIDRFDLVTVETNGTTPTRFNDFDCQVAISFESYIPEENDEIRGQGVFEKAIRKLQSINNPKLLRYTIYNDTDVIKMAMLAEKVGANSTGVPLKPVGKGIELRNRMPSRKKLIQSCQEIEMFDAQTKHKHIINAPYVYICRQDLFDRFRDVFIKRGRICEAGFNRIFISVDGIVTPCMFLQNEKIGNIKKDSPQELIDNLKRWLIKVKMLPMEGICSNCVYRNLCGGGCLVNSLEKDEIKTSFCAINGGG